MICIKSLKYINRTTLIKRGSSNNHKINKHTLEAYLAL